MLPTSYRPPPSPDLETRCRFKHPCISSLSMYVRYCTECAHSPMLHLTLTRNQQRSTSSMTSDTSPTVRLPPPPPPPPPPPRTCPRGSIPAVLNTNPHPATNTPWQCRPGGGAEPLFNFSPSHIPFLLPRRFHPLKKFGILSFPWYPHSSPSLSYLKTARERKRHSRHLFLSPSHSPSLIPIRTNYVQRISPVPVSCI
ncbi:hypothetical protein CCUS01_16066 [Colletotrichum cuscutae]|uniref:Uncharacterized protein n=1 Tax=Colletotrichum cuscutae TaxID=1209917 RepID=A0AAI9VCC2_9PEZI|nr:hypothetical protein CCUS01_16066 [Colletotrichum cuscutae]